MGARIRIAIIGCESSNEEAFTYGSRRYSIRHLIRKKIEAFGPRYEPLMHWPPGDVRDFPATKSMDAVIIPGSQSNIDDKTLSKTKWLRKLLDFIADVHGKMPMLGISFGHQAIARAFGSQIRKYGNNIYYEIGFEPTVLSAEGRESALFTDVSEKFMAMYSHFYYIDAVPAGVVLAKSGNEINRSIQAYRIGSTTYGIQFHAAYSEDCIFRLAASRSAEIMRPMPGRMIRYSIPEREDHKVLANFLRMIS